MRRQVTSNDQLLKLLDELLSRGEVDWKTFYDDRGKKVPFFVNLPDENLVDWVSGPLSHPGRCLDIGCGAGRNAIWLAEHGWRVDAVDISTSAIDWAMERATHVRGSVCFKVSSIFDYSIAPGKYDLVYDGGCFHHLPPHRRASYCVLVQNAMSSRGLFGLTCFNDKGGSRKTDAEVYENWRMYGGLAYTDTELRNIFGLNFDIQELRAMRQVAHEQGVFGVDFLWVAQMRSKVTA